MKQIRIFICMVLAGVLCFSTMALAENSTDAEALIRQGDTLVEQGDISENLEEAMKLYLQASRVEPDNEEAYLRVADVLIRQNKFEDAKLFLKSALITTTEERPLIQEKLDEMESGRYTDRSEKLRRREMYDGDGNLLWAHEYTYDEQGRQASVTWLDGAGNVQDVVELEYDEHGTRTKGFVYYGDTGALSRLEATHTYDDLGRRIHSVNSAGNEEFFEYDDNDNRTKLEAYNKNGELYTRYVYQYDSENRLIHQEYTTFNHGSVSKVEEVDWIYEGEICTETRKSINGELSEISTLHYFENGEQSGADTYNPEGKLIRSWYYDGTGKKVEQEFTW